MPAPPTESGSPSWTEDDRLGNHRTFVVSVRDEAGTVVLRAALSLVVEEGTLDD
jgi:hypothetical protein